MTLRTGLLSLAILLGGCVYELECTDIALYGVHLEITEVGGPRDEPIEIRYRVDGGEWRTDAECGSRDRCALGPELAGDYQIEVTRGAATVTVETRVAADRCHVIPETVPIELPDV